ncbi:MAG: hypothetical protein RL345_125, partial [Chloroflexota bacterium]
MRVLIYASSQRWLGGIGNQSALLARELVGMGHEVTVIGFGGPISTDVGPHVALPRRIPMRGGTVRFRPFEFGYYTVAPAGNYLFALPRIIRWSANPVIERLLRIAFPDNPGGHGSQFLRRTSEVVNALTGSFSKTAHEASFLSRLLLETDSDDIAQIIRIRESCDPDVEYACDLSLVPLTGKLPVRRSPIV